MPRATCRCGHTLNLPDDGPERVVCPQCSAKIRVRRDRLKEDPGDGFVRFSCPCGRRLKVRAGGGNSQVGKCPECGRVVPVPSSPSSSGLKLKPGGNNPESPTEELSSEDIAALERWAQGHTAAAPKAEDRGDVESTVDYKAFQGSVASVVKIEAGLRVCPRCGRPVHLSAESCRECGAAVPKR